MTKGIVSTQQQEQHQQQEDGQSIGSSSSGSSGAGTGSGGGGLALKKGPWTAAEDAVLIEHVKKNGEGNWNSVQKNTGLARCGKSCRLRWTNHLRPNLKKGSFTPEEERLILKLHSQLGNKWARMATQLPGRTDNEIKNYWNTRIKHRIRQGLPLYPQDINPEHLPSSSVPQSMEPRSNTATQLHTQTPIQILTQPRPTSQDLPETPSSTLLSPQYSQHHLKSSFNNGLFYPSSSLACPASTFTNIHTTPVLASSPLRLNGTYEDTAGFSLSFLPMSLRSSPLPSVSAQTQLPNMGSFQFSRLSCNVSSPQHVQTQLDSDRYSPSVSEFPSKSELPSSQSYLSQIGKPEIDVKQRLGVYRSGSGLLEDLLEEAQALSNENLQTPTFMNLRAEKLNVSLRSGCDWDARSSVDGSAANLGHSHYEIDTHKGFGLPLAQEGTDAEKVAAQQIYAMEEEDFSKLLNAVPSTLQRGNLGHSTPDIDTSASAEADITMGGHEMQQQIASSHPASTAVDNEITLGPSSWDNLPGIC